MRGDAVRSFSLAMVIVAGAIVGCGSGAKQGKSLVQQYQDALKVTDAGLRARRLVAVAEKQQKAGDISGASSSLGAAKEAAAAVSDPAGRANSLIYLAGAYARLDSGTDQVKQLLRDASKAIERIEAADAKVLPLADLAAATSVHLQNTDAATYHLKTAEEFAATIEPPANRVQALGRIARAYGKSKQDTQAQRLLAQAEELASGQADPRTKTDCLAELAAAWHGLGKSAEAQAAFTAAEEAAATIGDQQSQAYALLNIAQKAKASKQAAEARKLLVRAQDLAGQVKDGSVRGPLLEEIDAALKQL